MPSFHAIADILIGLGFVAIAILFSRLPRCGHGNIHVLEDRTDELQRMNTALEQKILERKLAEEHHQANFRRLEATIDSLPLGAAVIDEHGIIIHANQKCCDLLDLHCTPQDLLGLKSDAYFTRVAQETDDPIGYVRAVHGILRGSDLHSEREFRMRDGRTIHRTCVRILAENAARGYLLLYRDITKERRVDASKSEFMSLASHQLRTPLTMIRWGLGRLGRALAGKITAPEAALITESKVAATRMAHTIDTMLAISRIEAGKIRMEVSDVKLGALLNDIRVDCREMSESRQQTVSLDCPPNLTIRTDPHILTEILQNLYTNAIKYTPPGGKIILRGELRHETVTIEVEDNGHGIPLHQQEKIFRKFFRADNITATDTEGTGLGLYLVSLLVRLLKGSIGFVSVEGKGTTFTLTIPSVAS